MANDRRLTVKYSDLLYVLALFLVYTESFICSLYNVLFPGGMNGLIYIIVGMLVLIYLNKPALIRFRVSRSNIAFCFLTLAICVIIAQSISGSISLWTNLKYILIYLSILCCLDNEKWIRPFFGMSMICSLVFIVTTIWLYFDTNSFYSLFAYNLYPYGLFDYYLGKGITSGITDHYSHNGIMLANSLILWVSCFVGEDRPKKKKIILVVLLLNLVAMIMCGKRGQVVAPIIAVMCAMIVLYRILHSTGRLAKLILSAALIISIVYVASIFSPVLDNYLSRFSGLESDGTLMARYVYWALALNQFVKNPVTGMGWLQFRTINPDGNDPHNIYIQILCETGIVGALVFGAFYLSALVVAYRNLEKIASNNKSNQIDRRNCFFAFAGQISFLVYGLSGNPQTLYYSLIPYLLSCAIAYNYKNKL